jgi:hypothetical protein
MDQKKYRQELSLNFESRRNKSAMGGIMIDYVVYSANHISAQFGLG